jgi:predicted ribosomally synthesized peptide with nif11-like leader
MKEKLNELLQDEAFLQKLLAADSDTDVQTLLSENGVELTVAEIATIKTGVEARISSDNEELSEEDLENVAGGSDVSDIITSVFDGLGSLGDKVHEWTRRHW